MVYIYRFVQWFHRIFDSHDTDMHSFIFHILMSGNFTLFNMIYNARIFYIILTSLVWGNVYWYTHIHYILYVTLNTCILNTLLALERGGYFAFSSVHAVKAAAQTLPWVFFIFLTLFSTEVICHHCDPYVWKPNKNL